MTEEQLAARVKELEEQLKHDADEVVDPQVLAKAKSMLSFSVNDIKIALEILGVTPTVEQQHEIEQALLKTKTEAMTDKENRETIVKW